MFRFGAFLGVGLWVLILSRPAFGGEWLCKEASSKRSGSVITACGVGQGPTLQEAREASLSAAIREFERVCSISADCKSFEAISEPLRTECSKDKGGHECYRAVRFIISTIPKKSILVDPATLRSEISQKQDELRRLREQVALQEEAVRLDEEVSRTELELAGLKDKETDSQSKRPSYAIRNRDLSFGFAVEVAGTPIEGVSLSTMAFGAFLEKRPLRFLGVQGRLSYRYGVGGERFAVADKDEYEVSGLEVAAALPIRLSKIIIKPEAGVYMGTYTRRRPTIVGSIVDKTNLTSQSTSLTQHFFGGSLGYVFKDWTTQVGIRAYQGSNGFDGADAFRFGLDWQTDW